jgi:hypothetical protein
MFPFDAHDEYDSSLIPQGAWSVIYFAALCPGGDKAPMLKLSPYVLLFQPERIADRHEGDEPARVIAEKPILSLLRALNKPLLCLKLFMKTEKSIFEHSLHQRRLRARDSEFDPRVEELLWQHANIGRPLIPGFLVCRRRFR